MKLARQSLGGILLSLTLVSHAFADCDPVKFRRISCPPDCDQDYCETQGQLVVVITDPKTGEITNCGYYWTRTICGGVACAPPSNPVIRIIDVLMGTSEARAEDAADAKPKDSEIKITNPHGDFSLVEPSIREQESAGIGLHLATKGGELTVQGVGKDSPAEKSGLRQGDVVASVDGKSMRGVGLEQAIGALRGKAGTMVVVGIRMKAPKSGIRKVPLIRQHSAYSGMGETHPKIEVRDFEKAKAGEKCPSEQGGCLFLIEKGGRCYYSCKSDVPESVKGN